ISAWSPVNPHRPGRANATRRYGFRCNHVDCLRNPLSCDLSHVTMRRRLRGVRSIRGGGDSLTGRVSRRAALRGGAGIALGAASLGVLPLFGTPDRKQDPARCRTGDLSASDRRLVISNWPGYIDEDDGEVT